MNVTLATHCHSRDLPRLHAPGVLEELISCHAYPFLEVLVTHQRTGPMPYALPDDRRIRVLSISEEDYPGILKSFGMNPDDPGLAEICHGPSWQWWWQNHCVNHCTEILAANSDYIIFNDADCRILSQPYSWVEKGIEILQAHPEILVISPSDGGHEFQYTMPDGTRVLQMMSQQLFMGRTEQFKAMDFTYLQWDGKFIDGGPMQEFYGMFEGWLWRYMRQNKMYRAILPETFRYWHLAWH